MAIAFLFSGQGAQSPGMGQKLYARSPAARRVFDRAEAMRPGTLRQCFSAPKETLSLTINTQPCLFCVDLAAAEALREGGVTPAALAGFSLGEIPALAFSGMLLFEDAFRLVCERAQAMQACAEANPGGMVAVVGLESHRVEDVCEKTPGAFPVNYNCPGQLVVAGRADAMERVAIAVREMGGRALPLSVSGPFHTPMMAEAEAAVAACLSGMRLNDPAMPVYANLTARPYEKPYAPNVFRQVTHPVRFEETLHNMALGGIDTFIEVGVGKTLRGFVRKTLPSALSLNVEDDESLEAALRGLHTGT